MSTNYGAWVELVVTNLQSLVNDAVDPFTSWQSDRVDNQTTTKADDFEIRARLSTAATAPANDSAFYIYTIPWVYDGTTWTPGANFGTITRPTGVEGTAIISEPNSMKGAFSMPYKVTSQPLDGWFTIRQMCGLVPDGWSLAGRSNTGAALGTGCVISYRPITFT